MKNINGIIETFTTQFEVENSVKTLERDGFNTNQLSIIGKNYKTTDNIHGFLIWHGQEDIGKDEEVHFGVWIGGLFSLLKGAGLLFIPGVGSVIVAGYLTSSLGQLIEETAGDDLDTNALSSLTSILSSLGMSEKDALRYETQVRAGRYLLISTGTQANLERAQEVLNCSDAVSDLTAIAN
ncbi:MAG TPA: general stress protein [Elainellaceae cyanobacterium]